MWGPRFWDSHIWARSGYRAGLGDLPDDLVILIFSFLPPSCLRLLRLVCRSFRRASIPCISAMRLATADITSVAGALHAFPKIATLTIQAAVPASSWEWPQRAGQLNWLSMRRRPWPTLCS